MGENDFILSIFIVFGYIMLLLIYYRLLTCISNRVYDDVDSVFSSDDDDRDRGIGFSDDHVTITIKDLAGIDPSVLQSIPVVDFNSRDFKDGFKCIVCLSNLSDGDRTRLLPACNHWFHADCIDTWLQSHSTCPICRTEVGSVQRGTRPELGYEGLTTNVAVTQDASSGEAISYCDEHREHMRRLL